MTKVAKPQSFIKTVPATSHWDFYDTKNALLKNNAIHERDATSQRLEADAEARNIVSSELSTSLSTSHATTARTNEMESSETSQHQSTSHKMDTWNRPGKWLPADPNFPCYNLRGEVKATLPKLKKDRKFEALIEETKQIAINGPGSVAIKKIKPAFQIGFDAAHQLVVKTQPIKNKFARETEEIASREATQKSLQSRRQQAKQILTKEALCMSIFDEAMLDSSYSTNLAYKTSSTQKRPKFTTTKSSKIIRLQKSHSNLHKSTTKSNIFQDLKKKPLLSGFRQNLQNDDKEGRRVLRFMTDLKNAEIGRTDHFHMVKGADRRDVSEITDRVTNEYLDQMLNKIADI